MESYDIVQHKSVYKLKPNSKVIEEIENHNEHVPSSQIDQVYFTDSLTRHVVIKLSL